MSKEAEEDIEIQVGDYKIIIEKDCIVVVKPDSVAHSFTPEALISMSDEHYRLQEENRQLQYDANYNNPSRWIDEYVALITDKTYTVSKMSDTAKGELKAMLLGQSQAYGDCMAMLKKFIGDKV